MIVFVPCIRCCYSALSALRCDLLPGLQIVQSEAECHTNLNDLYEIIASIFLLGDFETCDAINKYDKIAKSSN